MKSAIVILKKEGTVDKSYSPDNPKSKVDTLSSLLSLGYIVKRETLLADGKVLIVLEKP